MRILLFMIMSCFVFTSTTNAAMLCCWSKAGAAHEMHMDQDTNKMPCHNMAENQQNNNNGTDDSQSHSCNDCDCKSCSQLTAIVPNYQTDEQGNVINRSFTKTDPMSDISDGIFYPPKLLS